YLGSRKEMEGILLGFYLSAIKKLSATKARRAARQLCENDLLSKDGHRESMSGRRIRQEYGLDEGQLDILVDARLLRKEPRLGDFGYELTHDSLTRPVMQNRPFRLPSRLWYTIGGLVGVILLVATLVSWQQYQIAEMAREGAEKQRDAADLARTEAERQAQLAEERRQEAETAKKNEEQRSKLTAEKYTDLLDRYKETGTKTERLQMEKEQLKQEIKQALASTNEQRDKKLAALRKKNDQLGNENEQLTAELEGLRERAQQLIDKNTQLVQAQSAEQVQTLQTQIRLLQDQLNQAPG
ncbi:MAG: hypothetical protein GY731_13975, partial [Gammaproteobacteria bacterium]|nr:hypothetical protein [Gammaproteobacteria bacterium]